MIADGPKRALVATDESTISLGWEQGYHHHGWDCEYGTNVFLNKIGRYDVVHILWPEEYCGWVDPSSDKLSEIADIVRYWAERSLIIFTVNNLLPHYVRERKPAQALYEVFYRHCHLVTHFSETSKRLVNENFSPARCKRHLVHGQLPYDVALESQLSRGDRRNELKLKRSDFVVLLLGSIRNRLELQLIMKGVEQARLKNLRLLVVGKAASPTCLTGWWSRFAWKLWLARNRAIARGFVPENELARYIDSSDAILVPRVGGLNSALIMIGMTFGRALIVPDLPQYLEPIEGTENVVYKAGEPDSLAVALTKASRADLENISRANAERGRTWTWDRIVGKCLSNIAEIASEISVGETSKPDNNAICGARRT